MTRGIVLGTAAVLLGPAVLVLGAGAGTAAAAGPAVTVCGVDASALRPPLLRLTFKKLKKVYYAGGSWSKFRLDARNRTGTACSGVLPVVVFGAQGKGLHKGDVRLQWRAGNNRGAWHTSSVLAEEGTLVALVGPRKGLRLPAGSRVAVPLRMRFANGAPTGRWVTLAIGFEPVTLDGEAVPLPLGVSDPHLFLVEHGLVTHGPVGHRPGPDGRPQLAETGGSAAVAAAGGLAVLALGGGAGLVALSRRPRG